jgi:hypothetical protein
VSKAHECREDDTCSCSVQALEPNGACPIHGGGVWPPRCGECGKFLAATPTERADPKEGK